jgi:hypothetical protein
MKAVHFAVWVCLLGVSWQVNGQPNYFTFIGEWTDPRWGGTMFICITNGRLHAAYSGTGVLQAVVQSSDNDLATATGFFYEGGGGFFECVHGPFSFVLSDNGTSISGQFDCPYESM